MFKIAFFDLEGWEEDIIRNELKGHDLYFTKDGLDKISDSKRNDFEIISFFVSSRVDKELLKNLPDLKMVSTMSTGYDHIDLKTIKERDIKACYVPGYGDNTVAEFTFGLILSLVRKTYYAIDRIKETGSFDLIGLRGRDLKGKTLGVIGTGRIGKETVKIAKGFGMKVIAYDIFQDEEFSREIGYTYVGLSNLLKESDIITLHTPYNKDTHHLINKKNIKLIKRGAYLINTARGGLIETDALVEALQSGHLAGAGLDVLEKEQRTKNEATYIKCCAPRNEELKVMLENHILMEMPNVLITPHNAFNTNEAVRRILNTTIGNIKGFIDGKPTNVIPDITSK